MADDLYPNPIGRDILLFCDGTSNTLTGGAADTNVVKLYELIAAQGAGRDRLLYYDRGVGAPDAVPPTGFLDWMRHTAERLLALASGRGVYENVARAYTFLMRHWRGPEDRIFLFGFSRGAFTARAVAGMVDLFGIARPEHESMVTTLVNIYFSPQRDARGALQRAVYRVHRVLSKKGQEALPVGGHASDAIVDRSALADQARRMFAAPDWREASVFWVGVWDTVDSVGLPGPLSRSNPSAATWQDKRITHARHALSLDEHRWTFQPRLFEEPGDLDIGGRTLRQRWFPGAHCDVGGSYPSAESALSDDALAWMVHEMAPFIELPQYERPMRNPEGLRHDPLWNNPWWALAGMTVRDMAPTCRAPGPGGLPPEGSPIEIPEGPAGGPSSSVWERRRRAAPLLFAMATGLVSLTLSGFCLLPIGAVPFPDDDWTQVVWAAILESMAFASQQLASLWSDGLLASGAQPWFLAAQPGWYLFWDMVFIASYGYVLSRLSSRAFTALAGVRAPGTPLPAWRWLGLGPLVAVAGDVAENLFTWLALLGNAMGSTQLAHLPLWLAGVAAASKLIGFAASSALLAVRFRIAFDPGFWWTRTSRDGRRGTPHFYRDDQSRVGDVYALLVLALVLCVTWGLARTFVCWGDYGWIGALACNAHYAVVVSWLAGGVLTFLVWQTGTDALLPAAAMALEVLGGAYVVFFSDVLF